MAESIPTPTAPDSPLPRRRLGKLAAQGICLLAESIAFIWLIDRLANEDWMRAMCLAQFVLAAATATIIMICARTRQRRVYEPLKRLSALIPEIRAGNNSPEDLAGIGGELKPLAAELQELFTELRTQRHSISAMERELKHQVASKTEALERKIGSLRQQATRDALTGLLNRRALDEHLAEALERAGKTKAPLSVLMIDVDNFKPLNDSFGHAAGDELLRSLGQIFRSTLRENDTAFRCGGDEFVVVLDGSDGGSAKALAERLTLLVDGLTRTMKVPAPPRLSIGAASLEELPEPSIEALLRQADSRLYAVKSQRKRIPRQRSDAPTAPAGHLPGKPQPLATR